MKDVDLERLISRIQQLYQERQELLAGSLSPVGAWIHTYEIKRQYSQSSDVETYCYAKWQAHDSIFKRTPKRGRKLLKHEPKFTKHKHIGRVWSSTGLGIDPEVEEAYRQWNNRLKLEAIESTLSQIQNLIDQFGWGTAIKPEEEDP